MTLARKVRAARCHLEIHVSSLYFLTELLLGKKIHYEGKRIDFKTNFFFAFAIGGGLLSHFDCIL